MYTGCKNFQGSLMCLGLVLENGLGTKSKDRNILLIRLNRLWCFESAWCIAKIVLCLLHGFSENYGPLLVQTILWHLIFRGYQHGTLCELL